MIGVVYLLIIFFRIRLELSLRIWIDYVVYIEVCINKVLIILGIIWSLILIMGDLKKKKVEIKSEDLEFVDIIL